MTKLTPDEKKTKRKAILELIDLLLKLDAIGWDVDMQLRACGEALCSDYRPQYRPEGVTLYEYHYYLEIAKQHDVPVKVYKDRLRRLKHPSVAATTPYFKISDHPEKRFLEIAAENGVSSNTYHYRRRRGWSQEKAAHTPVNKLNRI